MFDSGLPPQIKSLKLWQIENQEGSLFSGKLLQGLDHKMCVRRNLTEKERRQKRRQRALMTGQVTEDEAAGPDNTSEDLLFSGVLDLNENELAKSHCDSDESLSTSSTGVSDESSDSEVDA